MTLRIRVMISFVLVVALSLGFSGYVFLRYFEDSFRDATYRSLDSIAKARAESISDYLRLQSSAVHHIASMIPLDALRQGDYRRLDQTFALLKEEFPVFENGFFILSPDGDLLVDYPSHPETRGKNFAHRDYFQRTMLTRAGVVGQPYRSARTGKEVLTFTHYLSDEEGRPVGVLGCSAQLLAESDLGGVRRAMIGKTGYGYVYDSSRLMILHPKDDRVLTRDVPVGANRMYDAALNGFRGAAETVNSRGVQMLVAFASVRGNDWIVACQQPAAEAFAALETTKLQILFFVFCGSLVAALIGVLLVHQSTVPLVRLEEVTAKLKVPGHDEQDLDTLISGETAKLEPFINHPEFGPLAGTVRELYARLGVTLAESRDATTNLETAYMKLKQTQAQILQQEKMASIGQLAAGVAHEINNPMGFITSNLGTLAKYLQKLFEYQQRLESWLSSGAEDGLQRVKEERSRNKIDFLRDDIDDLLVESKEGAERVREIVQNLKGFSRVDQAEQAEVNLNDCLEKTLSIVNNELKYKARIVKDYGDLPPYLCYPQQLNQVFMNLLINAAHAIEGEGMICISTRSFEDRLQVEITDNGCGISEEHLERIFEPFFTTKEIGKGTGLGMSISYEIIKKHAGDILVASEVGKGTTFTIVLPLEGRGKTDV